MLFVISVLCFVGCTEQRPCLEQAECFGGEYCAAGLCKPYKGKQNTNPRPYADAGRPYDDIAVFNPFEISNNEPSDFFDSGDREPVFDLDFFTNFDQDFDPWNPVTDSGEPDSDI